MHDEEIKNLRPDLYSETSDGFWYWNKANLPVCPTIKLLIGFNNPCLFNFWFVPGKIGRLISDERPDIHTKYIGFFYGTDDQQKKLLEFARRFSYAEIITNLNSDGTMSEKSEVIPLITNDEGRDIEINPNEPFTFGKGLQNIDGLLV